MSEEHDEIPEGAAVFPQVPAELNVHPLLLSSLHAVVFLSGSTSEVVNQAAADEALDCMVHYLERLDGAERQRMEGDIATLRAYAKEEKWDKGLREVFKMFEELCEPEEEEA